MIGDQLAAFIRRVMADTRYHQVYGARVERSSDDNTVDLVTESEALQGFGLQNVPVRPGLPNTIADPQPGARCQLAFEEGDPKKPYVSGWDDLTPGTIRLNQGTLPVARMGDSVEVFVIPVFPIEATISVVPDIPAGVPLLPGVLTMPPGLPTTLPGYIETGAPEVQG